MKIKYMLTLLRTMRIPGLFSLMKDWQSFLKMHFIYAALDAGLPDALPASREKLIRKLNVRRPEILDALLDMGLSLKELAYENGSYRIRGKRTRAITGDKGDMLAAMIQANVTYYNSAYRNAAARMRGDAPLGDDLGEIGDVVARFSKIGEPIIRNFLSDMITGKDSMRILDVGCGSGIFLRSACEANPNATGIGIDMDEAAAEQARQNMEKWGLTERFGIIRGDVRASPDGISSPFDLITLFNLLYYVPVEERTELLGKLVSMLSPGGMVAVVMNFQSNGVDMGAANLNMVNASLNGLTCLPSLEEITTQLTKIGLGKIRIQRLIPGSTFYGIAAGAA